jgi:hypothetical protein
MIADMLREILSREPLWPLRVRVSTGPTYQVRDPSQVVPMTSELFLARPNSDRWTIIPYLHIAALDLLDSWRTPRRCR